MHNPCKPSSLEPLHKNNQRSTLAKTACANGSTSRSLDATTHSRNGVNDALCPMYPPLSADDTHAAIHEPIYANTDSPLWQSVPGRKWVYALSAPSDSTRI